MMRIGHSTDIHRLEPGNTLILGGVKIPSPYQSVGHSDADCLLHSMAEALLGSLALGDLGSHFPDTNDEFRDLDSGVILRYAHEAVQREGYEIGNIDALVFLEKPKLSNYIDAMRATVANLLNIKKNQVSIKATTGEKIGMVGSSQAIVCETVVLVKKVK